SINPTRRSFCNLNGCRNGGQGCVEKSAYWEIGTIQCTKPTKLAIRILATGERGQPAQTSDFSRCPHAACISAVRIAAADCQRCVGSLASERSMTSATRSGTFG